MADLMLALIAISFLTFGGVLSGVSIYMALAERAERRRRQPVLDALIRQAAERFKHRSEAGRAHVSAI